MAEATATRVCCSCKEAKSLDEFHRFAQAADGSGLQYKCKQCCSEYQARYNEQRGAARAQRRAEQSAANPERDRLTRMAYRARGHVQGVIDLRELWTGYCGICREPLDAALKHPDLMSKSIDHIVPLARGGAHTQENCQWAHLSCNARKGNRID